MRNLDKNGIYGQYNQAIEIVKEIILNNDDLVKFLYYRDVDFDIRDETKYICNKKTKEAVKQQILNYNSLEGRDANAYVIVDMGMATREKKGNINSTFVNWRTHIYIACHESICETKNGDRIRCLEQCICDSFTNEEVEKTFGTNIGSSQTVSVSEGLR